MKATQQEEKEYEQYIKQVTPTHNTFWSVCRAFVTGGIICLIGEYSNQMFMKNGVGKEEAAAWTLVILIGAAVLLTGLNLFSKLAKFAGAGVLVPITGFANSVVAPAIEYKKEERVIITKVRSFAVSGGYADLVLIHFPHKGGGQYRSSCRNMFHLSHRKPD